MKDESFMSIEETYHNNQESSCNTLITPKLKKQFSPILLKHGLTISHNLKRALPHLYWSADSICFLPTSQDLISHEVFDDYHKQRKGCTNSTSIDKEERTPPADDQEPRTRLDFLEYYLLSKKVLFPFNKWSDVYRWKDNLVFTMWLRREFLLAKYYNKEILNELLKLYPEVSVESMKKSPPCEDIVKKVFGMSDWSRKLDNDAAYSKMKQLASKYGGQVIDPLYGPILDDNLDMSNKSLEEILDVLGYQVSDNGLFNIYCEVMDVWPFWTKEYVHALAKYLSERCNDKETLILEVGAGDGRLSHFLNEAFKEMNSQETLPKIVATDDGSWEINHIGQVQKLNVQQSLDKYCNSKDGRQVIVVSSWMPNGHDWTCLFRQKQVFEYILIGETDDGNCAHVWYTWGNPNYNYYNYKRAADNQDIEAITVIPPYQFDGYVRVDLEFLSELQYARFDTRVSRCSSTVSFRRS